MTRIASVVLLAGLFTISASAQSPTPDDATLRHLEQTWVDAFLHKDSTTLARILADDWHGQYPWGNQDRAQALVALS